MDSAEAKTGGAYILAKHRREKREACSPAHGGSTEQCAVYMAAHPPPDPAVTGMIWIIGIIIIVAAMIKLH